MEDGLAVGADERDAARRYSKFSAGTKRGVSENGSETEIELAEFTGGDGLLLGDAENFLADGGRKGNGSVVQELGTKVR